MIVKGKLSRKHMMAIDHFADMLLTHQMKRHIMVKVVFKNKLPALGFTSVEDYNVSGKPRHFILEIRRNQTEKELLRTIAHEMVHVKQYACNEMNEEGTRWMNRSIDYDNTPYHEQPWEIEAHEIGDLIYEDFINDYR
jgi:hypothetical protein